VLKLTVAKGVLDWELTQVNKRPTRLPEATFFSFRPASAGEDGWHVRSLNTTLDPHNVLGKKGRNPDGRDWFFGGSPHLRGVESAHYNGDELVMSSLDVPLLAMGKGALVLVRSSSGSSCG